MADKKTTNPIVFFDLTLGGTCAIFYIRNLYMELLARYT